MPPEAITLLQFELPEQSGIMMGCPHLLHGTVASGGRSPGMKTLVSHVAHVTIFNGALSLALIGQSRFYHCLVPRQPSAWATAGTQTQRRSRPKNAPGKRGVKRIENVSEVNPLAQVRRNSGLVIRVDADAGMCFLTRVKHESHVYNAAIQAPVAGQMSIWHRCNCLAGIVGEMF